ncbi:hypothetical protein [Dyadobacter sp. Leaf189]|uniref:hypothetical protein n=1 Tax=Dyadobacter sp. Leaf189 TaxID=1736295 RepID=UPI0006F222C8|nr:hypothetical protein [Dyadobacter sp. Leaf189]KQS23797.1 hypothetical protein ASG33_24555 [Dyadobacter sp. Leaf189]
MWTTIEGVYENGQVTLSEEPPVRDKAKVLITFIEEKHSSIHSDRELGKMKGTIRMSDDLMFR